MNNRSYVFSLTVLISALIYSSQVPAQQVDSLSGLWIDERGSELQLAISNDDVVTGSYSPKIVSAECDGGTNSALGSRNQDQIAFTVTFEKCSLLLMLIGQEIMVAGKSTLVMSWISNGDIDDEYEEQAIWTSFNFGTSVFSR